MTELRQAAQAVLDRWDSPQWAWRQHGPTADLMADLRAALAQPPAPTAQQKAKSDRVHALVNAGPLPGMSEAFDAHMGAACWTDPAYAPDAATWAAAWKAAQPATEDRLRMALRADLATESLAVDDLLRAMGEDPEQYRTEGGAINRPRLLAWLKDRAAQPVALDAVPVIRTLSPEQIERHTLKASECPPDSAVMLVSAINRLLSKRPGDAIRFAQPAAVVYPPDGTVSPFTVINLGAGKVQMGDCIHDGRLPALWFGKNGQGMGHEEVMNRMAHEGETLAVITFSNVEGLDVLLDVIQRIRRVSFPGAAEMPHG